jgi:hypothetical protein
MFSHVYEGAPYTFNNFSITNQENKIVKRATKLLIAFYFWGDFLHFLARVSSLSMKMYMNRGHDWKSAMKAIRILRARLVHGMVTPLGIGMGITRNGSTLDNALGVAITTPMSIRGALGHP